MMATESSCGSRGIMTFYPSKEEFGNFSQYIAYMESQGAHRAGLAKVIPPKEWKPRQSYDDIDDLLIPAPIQQVVTGQSGLFTQYNIQKKAMTVREFRKTANSDRFCSPHYDNFEELERKYWKNVTFNPPIYGADVNGTLYDPVVKEWNVGCLQTILDTVERESGITIEGVNTPYLYFGMWKTTFAWHTEDMDLYSINYLHFGEPKSWYCVPPEHGKRLERLAKGFFPGSSQNCEAFLRHKMTLISPSILRKYGIPFEKITQEAGEFMVTFPYSYHAGFNHGFNCAESTNFAMQRWIDYGKHAVLCSCRKDMVKISMDVFVQKFQPERYALWLAGKDTGLVDHSKPTPEAAEFLGSDYAQNLQHNTDDHTAGEPTKSPTKHRIGLKRHQIALEVPENMLLKGTFEEEEESEEDDEKEYGKKAYLHWPTLSASCGIRGVPDYTCLTSQHKLDEQHGIAEHLPQDTTLNKMEKRQLPVCAMKTSLNIPLVRTSAGNQETDSVLHSLSALPRSVSKPGVASLLFHRTLSSSEALHVHNYSIQTATCYQHNSEKTPLSDLPASVKTDINLEEKPNKGPEQSSTHTVIKTSPVKLQLKGIEEKKKMKSQRHQLSKLPHQHPLMLENTNDHDERTLLAPSDETSNQDNEKSSAEKGEVWTRLLTDLWQHQPHNIKAEQSYNQRMGQQPPYCAICTLFYTYNQSDFTSSGINRNCNSKGPGEWRQSSLPLIPEMCFNSSGSTEGHLSTPYLQEDGSSHLVSCVQCCVRVHASCYGISNDTSLDGWRCTRCEASAITQDCCLCSLRGGALKRANNNKWVHVLCAVAVLEARFVSVVDRGPVDLSKIPLQRFKLKCYYCRKFTKKTMGCCVQCSHGRCPTAFHPTCAQAAGVLMYPDDWPFVVYITCHRHKGISHPERNKVSLQDLVEGQQVICKHKNGRYYQAEVVELTKATFYEVIFDDGSFSDNLFPEDITNRDCVELGPPPEGTVVQVRWTDGLVYGAKFVAEHVIPMYMVDFEDGSQLSVKRDDVYSLNEDLPKRVKTRLSVASDMRFKGVFVEKEVNQDSKRQRVINSRYREDYIEPVIF
ncbi:lysine-specific demethylase 4A isoform X1 [Alosa sapidissima]|uniref:lysine-specific demethylase 4A isoform X1 n=2 Tax=Alosa sapidissima TaxID=34773 RepID=UPI001C097C2C|nr:lysine-specific demethylase 4A isoform X1 [Alosa sapidissima]